MGAAGCTSSRRMLLLVLASLCATLGGVFALAIPTPAYAQTQAPEWVADTDSLPGATVYRDAQSGLVRSLIGNFSFYGVEGTPEDIGRLFLSEYSDVLSVLPDTADLVFEGVREGGALRHVRFHQAHYGIPVWRGTVTVHMTKDQVIMKVDNHYLPGIALPSLTPELDESAAAWTAVRALSPVTELLPAQAGVLGPAELYVRGSDVERAHLVWVMIVVTAGNPSGWLVTLDATNGSVIELCDTRIEQGPHGYVFFPNPVVTYSGNPSRPSDPNGQRRDLPFANLTTTAHLEGSWAHAMQISGN